MSASFWILTKYYQLETQLETSLACYELAHSVDAVYKFLWDYYADWYVEYLKTEEGQLPFAKELFQQFVMTCSPYCPFETEVLWKDFFGQESLLASTTKDFGWTKSTFESEFGLADMTALETDSRFVEFQRVIDFVADIRSTRGLFAIDPANQIQVFSIDVTILKYTEFVKMIAKTELINQDRTDLYSVNSVGLVYSIDILGYIKDKTAEIKRTEKIILDLNKQILGIEAKLNNPKFVENAEPEVLVESKSNLIKRNQELSTQLAKVEFLGR